MKKNLTILFLIASAIITLMPSCKKNKTEPIIPAKESYTVTFNSNGGSETDKQTIVNGNKAGKPTDPTYADHTFAGWYADTDLTTPFNFDTPVTINTTIYAAWNPNTSDAAFNDFITKARFMPNDPRQMTADDKTWFTQNAAFKFNYEIKTTGFVITADQENRMRVYIDGILKTLNYLVYTKPFALATKGMFADRAFHYIGTSTKADNLPSAIGTILLMRGLNTDILADKKMTFELTKTGGSYYGTIGSSNTFDTSRDKYTSTDLKNGKRATYLNPGEPSFGAKIVLPLGANGEMLLPYNDVWMYTNEQLKTFSAANPKPNFAAGFTFDLFVHELLHSFFMWNHSTGKADGDDLVYAYSGLMGWFMDLRSEYKPILTKPKIVPGGGKLELESQSLVTEFGGHLPCAVYKTPYWFGYNNGYVTYSMVSNYIQNQLNVPVYNTSPEGSYLTSTIPTPTNIKSVPKNPYDGITFKTTYLGVKP